MHIRLVLFFLYTIAVQAAFGQALTGPPGTTKFYEVLATTTNTAIDLRLDNGNQGGGVFSRYTLPRAIMVENYGTFGTAADALVTLNTTSTPCAVQVSSGGQTGRVRAGTSVPFDGQWAFANVRRDLSATANPTVTFWVAY